MATLQLNLPETLKAAAEAQAQAAGCESVDEYIAGLIQADELPAIHGGLEQELLAGLDSGPAIPFTPELMDSIVQKARGTGRLR